LGYEEKAIGESDDRAYESKDDVRVHFGLKVKSANLALCY